MRIVFASPSVTSSGFDPQSYPVMPAFHQFTVSFGSSRAASRPIPAIPTKFVPPSTRPGANGDVARQADPG